MNDYVCVIGGANIDICSTSLAPLLLRDSNPSQTTLSLGGVARNVAENLSRLGANVEFITVLGNDFFAKQIEHSCKELSISLAHSLRAEHTTSTYLSINDDKGDMFIASSDMDILCVMDKDFLASKMDVISGAKAVVIDTNLSAEILEFIITSSKAPVFVETVSANKAQKILGLAGAFGVKPNLIEAEMLVGMKINADSDLIVAANKLHALGYKWVAVTLGSRGAFYSDGTSSGFVRETIPHIVNASGAGDSFFAAMVWGYMKGLSLENACMAANRAAAITLMSIHTVSPALTSDKIFI